MEKQDLHGTNDWKEYSVTVPASSGAVRYYIGAFLAGTGKMWVDDLRVLVDGKPLAGLPVKPREPTALDKDHEFDKGSGTSLNELSPTQISNLARLGRV